MEPVNRIKAFFDPFIDTRYSDWKMFERHMEIVSIKKKGIIKPVGLKEPYLRFLLNGAGSIFITREEKDCCTNICFEDEFISDFRSLITGKPTSVYVRTFEPVEFVQITREQLFSFYNSSHLAAQLGRVLIERLHCKRDFRDELLQGTVKHRWNKLIEKYPDVRERVPQRHIASFIGVSPESLSRLRGRRE